MSNGMKLATSLENNGYSEESCEKILAAFTQIAALAGDNRENLIEAAAVKAAEFKLEDSPIIGLMLAQLNYNNHSGTLKGSGDLPKDAGEFADQILKLRSVADLLPERPDRAQSTEHMLDWLLSLASDGKDIMAAIIGVLAELLVAPTKQQARRAIMLYGPLADRFGFRALKQVLVDVAFKALKPKKYKEIERAVQKMELKESGQLKKIKNDLSNLLKHAGLKSFEIYGRHKSPRSIYLKLTKSGSLDKILDYIGIRVILPTTGNCYKALEAVHSVWPQVENRYKDYIATPKPNGYKSIHTVVMVDNKPVEIHIRTRAMHEAAEYGIAAHWKYDQLKKSDSYKKGKLVSVAKDKSKTPIFVLSPKHDVYSLPKGACALDFAFAIHSSLGMHAFLVKINGKVGKLSSVLNTGDVVEIITQKRAHPHEDWLRFVKTPKARNRIRAQLAGA